MSRKSGRKQEAFGFGLGKSLGNRKSVSVGFYPGKERSVFIEFGRPIERSDFNENGSIKTCALSSRYKGRLITGIRISETGARALRDILDAMLLDLDLQRLTT